MNKQDYLQWASFMQKCVYLQKIFKFLLFKMVEKAVRTALPELNPFFSEAVWKPGRSKVVCFTDMASIILSEQWYKDRKENFNDEKVRITTAAANSIENEKICKWYKTNVYRIVNQFSCWIPPPPSPPTLKLLMTVLVGQGLKQTSSGQCILKAIKSNSIIHLLLFGLKVEIDHATERYWQKFQSWDMLSPVMKLSDVKRQDG